MLTGRQRCALGSATAVLMLAGNAHGQENPVILQWFEQPWATMSYRMPDFFMAGYDAVWLPSPCKAASNASAGYDVFDRFDLGSASSPTTFGTDGEFRALVHELHRAGAEVYIDTILNHNSGRNTTLGFQQAGGWPGFWMGPIDSPSKGPTDNWGDFHNGVSTGFLQSEDPNSPRYDLERGDLVALVDIAQESNNRFIRHPVAPGDPDNIPAGTFFNNPDPDNVAFYPDRDLAPTLVTNPGTSRNPGTNNFTIYPFNTGDPSQGDPVEENATDLLCRFAQWMLEEYKVDGFRLDAAKHTPSWFWDTFFDSYVHLRRCAPDGSLVTPFTFVESVAGNDFTYNNFVRKDSFADRDALDLAGAGKLRDLVSAGGFGSWSGPLGDSIGGHIDNYDDGFNNGSVGVLHVYSHDNGTVGDGTAMPALPTIKQQGLFAHAYMLLRPGASIIYHNARGIPRTSGFYPREGVSLALGYDPIADAPEDAITRLVEIHNEYNRGQFYPLNGIWPSDAFVFEQATPVPGGLSSNLLVGANDRYDSGYNQFTVTTNFPAGTRLHELTGNAADPMVDPTNAISEVLVVDSLQRVTIRVPRNSSSAGEHNRGYVAYGPAVPGVTLGVSNVSSTIGADPDTVPLHARRRVEIPVVTGDSFRIQIETSYGDLLDNDSADDRAVYRINGGYTDTNGNGGVDYTSGVEAGYEDFLTVNDPLFGSANLNGTYEQEIDSAAIGEGLHYISVLAFRHRGANDAPLFNEERLVVYVDRVPPSVMWANQMPSIEGTEFNFQASSDDPTTTAVHFLFNVPDGVDPLTLIGPSNEGFQIDQGLFARTLSGLPHGDGELTIVALEESGNAAIETYEVLVRNCEADFNGDGAANGIDIGAFLTAYSSGDLSADYDDDGALTGIDIGIFLSFYAAGC